MDVIMTVPVQHRQGLRLVRVFALPVMQLYQVAWPKVQSTMGTFASLLLEEARFPERHPRITSHPSGPITPIPIIGTFGAAHLDVSDDARLFMFGKRWSFDWAEGPVWESPVFPDDPFPAFAGMAPVAPATQRLIQGCVTAGKRFAADDRPIIVAPPANDGIEMVDQGGLGCRPVVSDDLGQLALVADHVRSAGLYLRFEAKRVAPSVRAGTVFPHRNLTDSKTQKVEACFSVHGEQGMTNPCFAWFQFQTQVAEPCLNQLLTLLDDFLVRVANDEIIRVANQGGGPVPPLALSPLPFGEGLVDEHFHAMESDIGQEGGKDPSLGCALRGGKEGFPFQDARFQPAFDELA